MNEFRMSQQPRLLAFFLVSLTVSSKVDRTSKSDALPSEILLLWQGERLENGTICTVIDSFFAFYCLISA